MSSDLMIGPLLARVENEADHARLRTIRDLDAAVLRLRDACRVALDPRYPDLELRRAAPDSAAVVSCVQKLTFDDMPRSQHSAQTVAEIVSSAFSPPVRNRDNPHWHCS